jgi:acetyl-CoA acyltransferase
MREAYIVSAVRTPGCKRAKGALKDTLPLDLVSFILKSAVEKVPQLDVNDIDDVMMGCAFPEAEQGLNIGRNGAKLAGFPDKVSGATVNRFCASGLEAIADSAMRIMAGWSEVTIGGGIESMTYVPMGGNMPRPYPDLDKKEIDLFISMGITAENVANRYKITRQMQDEFAYHSQMKAAAAQKEGRFTEIIPTPAAKFVLQKDGTYKRETFLQDFDDGVRAETTLEGLGKLRPAFALTGSVTAGNSSQTTDGAAATVLMSGEKVKELGIKPLAKLRYYTTVGCRADEMGVGPRYAIPKLLKLAGMTVDDIDVWEINEAFASQALYCIRELGLEKYMDRINLNGGAIALGHPLGCTGAKLCATLIANMQRTGARFGVESMCIGGGMGAAALFELCD